MALALHPGQHYPQLGGRIVAGPDADAGRPGWVAEFTILWDCCGRHQIISYEGLMRRWRQGKTRCAQCAQPPRHDFAPGPLPAAGVTVLALGPLDKDKRPSYQVRYDCCGTVGWLSHWSLVDRVRRRRTQCQRCCPHGTAKPPRAVKPPATPPATPTASGQPPRAAKPPVKAAPRPVPVPARAIAWPQPAPDPLGPAAAWLRPASLAATPPAPWQDRAGWPRPVVTAPRVTRRPATPEVTR